MQTPARLDPVKNAYRFLTSAGKPAVNLLVYPYRDSPVGYGRVVGDPVHTDPNGYLSPELFYSQGFFALPEDGPVTVFTLPEKRLRDAPSPPLTLVNKATELVLRFTDGGGKPLEGVTVSLQPTTATAPLEANFVDWALGALPAPLARRLVRVTDADGRVTFPDLPQKARFGVGVLLPKDWPRLLAGAVTLGTTPRTAMPAVPILRDGVIEGRVYRQRDGMPLAGQPVAIAEPRPGPTPYLSGTVTDEQGRYRFTGLLLAPYHIGAGTRDWLRGNYTPCPPLTARHRQRRHDMPMIQAAKLHVLVVGADGYPVNRATVRLEKLEKQGQYGKADWTNITGETDLAAEPGTYKAYWTATPGDSVQRDVRRLTLRDGETTTVTFGPKPRTVYARLPDVILEEANGRRVTLGEFRGKIVLLALTEAAYTDLLKPLDALVRRWANRKVVGIALDVGRETPVKPPLISTLRYFREIGKTTKTQDFATSGILDFFAMTGVTTCCVLDGRGDIVALVRQRDSAAVEDALRTATAR